MSTEIEAILRDALRIADREKQADTTTAEGLLSYLASRFPNDVEDLLAKAEGSTNE